MLWLLDSETKSALEGAYANDRIIDVGQQLEYEASYKASASSGPNSRLLTVAGDSAEVSIKGVLTKSPDLMAFLFGGGNTTYHEVVSALAEADANSAVEKITLNIDSPGGQFDGLFDLLSAIQATKKPTEAYISGIGASAAYAIASQADRVVAANISSRVGSVGVVVSMGVRDDVVTIASSDAPKKRPDVKTEQGKAMVREELDAMHEIFAEAIAVGRGVDANKVNADFGQGATLLAREALKRGMIDAIAEPSLKVVKNAETTTVAKGGIKPETRIMNRDEFKAQHSDLYEAVMQEGVDKERDRVVAHLTMGEASGDTKTAFQAIKDGSVMTASLQASYMAAGMNRSDINARQDDDARADVGDVSTASTTEDLKESSVKSIFAKAAESCGIEMEI